MINPDGIQIYIKLDKFTVGASAFVPCINTEKARSQLTRESKKLGVKIRTKACIENKKWGIRVWRIV